MQLHHAIVTGPVMRARHDQRVSHAGPIGFKPALLGLELALNPSGFRRVQHGGINQAGTLILCRRLQGRQRI